MAVKKFHQWIDFVWSFTRREVRARYRGTMLGFLWMLLNPLLQMLIIGAIFQFFVPVKVDNYFAFLFAGLLPWNFFSLSVAKVTPSFFYERALIQKAAFPREVIPLSIIFSNFFHFFVALVLFFVVLVWSHFSITDWLLIVPLITWILLLTVAFGLLFATLNVRYRDVNFFVQALLPLWFYATPIIYTIDLVPATLHSLFYLNPVYYPVTLLRNVLLDEVPLGPWAITLGLGYLLVVLWLSLIVFRRHSPHFDDWM